MDRTLRALAAPIRRDILALVWEEERPAGDIADRFEVTFGAVSQHLRVLREAGLVAVRPDGRRRLYRARREALGPLARALEAEWGARLNRLKTLVEEETADGGHGRN
jgi:DNA-binding transcriptional ArsR family regulator